MTQIIFTRQGQILVSNENKVTKDHRKEINTLLSKSVAKSEIELYLLKREYNLVELKTGDN